MRPTIVLVALLGALGGACTGENPLSSTAPPTSAPPSTTTEAPVSSFQLKRRPGDPPRTTEGAPHVQLSQTSSYEMLAELKAWAFSLPGIVELPSVVPQSGTRAPSLRTWTPTRMP